jgi:hypothetical protein
MEVVLLASGYGTRISVGRRTVCLTCGNGMANMDMNRPPHIGAEREDPDP